MFQRIILFVCICIIICACDSNQHEVTVERLSRYRRFLWEATAFDYCGSSYSDNDVRIAARGYNENDVLRLYWSEHGHEYESVVFFELVNKLEKNLKENCGTIDSHLVDAVKVSLIRQKESVVSNSEKFSLFCYERNLFRLMYSIERCISALQCTAEAKSDIITRIVTDDLFMVDLTGCDWISVRDDWATRLKIFRDLLLVSCHVSRFSEADDWRISNIADSRLRTFIGGGCFRLLGNSEGWRIVYANKRMVNVKCISMNDFFSPQIGDCKKIFLSSDYAKRREIIFREGESLNEHCAVVDKGRIVIKNDNRR